MSDILHTWHLGGVGTESFINSFMEINYCEISDVFRQEFGQSILNLTPQSHSCVVDKTSVLIWVAVMKLINQSDWDSEKLNQLPVIRGAEEGDPRES